MLHDRIKDYLTKPINIALNLPLVLGVSGGADSLALLHILTEIGCPVTAAHFNHHIRPDAEDDAVFVAEAAKQLGVPFVRGDGDVAGLALNEKYSIETAARKARYRFLFESAEKISAQAVVTAHNADDQAETVLLHLVRGAGLTGLRGMQPKTVLREFSQTIPLVRPFLTTWRSEIDEYCRIKGLLPRVDTTNQDTAYARNRIRQELIPILETYNPQIKARLNGLAANVRSAMEILVPVVHKAYEEALARVDEGIRDFNREKMSTLSHALRVEIIRMAVEDLVPTAEDINQAALERAAALLDLPKGSRKTEMADGLTASVSGDQFRIICEGYSDTNKNWPTTVETGSAEMVVPGSLMLNNGWEIRSEWIDDTGGVEVTHGDQNIAIMDAAALNFPLTVRRRAAGDIFQPLGMQNGSLTLGDFFTNEKLPVEARADWPLVVSGGRIAWVAGVRIADFARVQPNSRRLVRLRLLKTA